MFIYLKYGSEKDGFVIEFEKNCFVTVCDVLERVRCRYGEHSNLQLVSKHMTLLKHGHVVEKARTYGVKRLVK